MKKHTLSEIKQDSIQSIVHSQPPLPTNTNQCRQTLTLLHRKATTPKNKKTVLSTAEAIRINSGTEQRQLTTMKVKLHLVG